MAALTGPRTYTLPENANTRTLRADSLTYKKGSLIGFRPSTGYAVKWDGTADDVFVGVAVGNGSSASSVIVDARSITIKGYEGNSVSNTAGILVTGVSSIATHTDAAVYCASDNLEDATLTPTSAQAIGKVEYVVNASTTRCWIFLTPTPVFTGNPSDFILGDNLAAALDIREASTSYLKFVTTNSAEAIVFNKPLTSTAGMSSILDVSAAATGESDIVVKDNVASALEIREAANSYLTIVTTDNSEAVKIDKILDANSTVDHDVALTATGDGINSATTISHASNTAEGLDVSIAQITNARTSGEIIAVKASVTSLTGSTAGTDHSAFYAGVTVGAAAADHFALKQGAGFDATIDASGCATTEAGVQLPDNVAAGWQYRQSTTALLTIDTTDNAEEIEATARLTTTDGVASGTARVVGGRAYSAVSASDNLLASAGGSAHVVFAQTYSIPASTLKANSILRIKYQVAVTDASGTDTLETKLYIGGTTSDLNGTVLMTTTAFDPSATTDFVIGEFDLVARAAPGAAASCAGCGKWVTQDNGTEIYGAAVLAPTNLATNGALIVKVSAKWSATTASTNARLDLFNVEII